MGDFRRKKEKVDEMRNNSVGEVACLVRIYFRAWKDCNVCQRKKSNIRRKAAMRKLLPLDSLLYLDSSEFKREVGYIFYILLRLMYLQTWHCEKLDFIFKIFFLEVELRWTSMLIIVCPTSLLGTTSGLASCLLSFENLRSLIFDLYVHAWLMNCGC